MKATSLERIQARKYSIEEITPLLELCVSEDTLHAIIGETEDLRVLELALRIEICRAAQAETKTQLFNGALKKLLGMITPDNHDRIWDILTVILLAEPSDANFRCFLKHLRDNSEDAQVTTRLLEIALNTCTLEVIDEAFLVELYLKVGGGQLRELLVRYAELSRSCPEIVAAVLRNKDLQTLVCLSDVLAPTRHPEFWGFLQSKVLSDAHSDRKLALYILKGCIKVIASENQLGGYMDVVHNRVGSASDFARMWGDFFNLIEALDDHQLHLITPSLTLLEGIGGIHPMWLTCVYKSMLTHSLNSVAFHGLTRLLHDGRNMGVSFFKTVVKYVLVALNKTDNSGEYYKSLFALKHFVRLCNNEVYIVLMEASLSAPWVPSAAWYFYKTVLNRGVPMSIFAELIRKLKTLPHKFIREGCLSLAVDFLDFNEDVSFEESLTSAACVVECDSDVLPPKFLSKPTWKKKDVVCNELERWQRDKVFVSASKVHALMKLIEGDDAISCELFSLAKDRAVPLQTRDCIVLHLSKSYLSKPDIIDYIRQRMCEVKADDDFDLLTDIVINNVTPNEPDVKLKEQSAHIISNSKDFERHQVQLAIAIACCLGHCLGVTQILGAILKETKAKLCDFFVLKYCALAPPEDEAFQLFEDLLNTQGEDVVAVVFKNLPDVIGCFRTEDVSKFLGFCYSKLGSLRSSSASAFRAGLKQYLTCRFHLGEVNRLLKQYEPSAYTVADILEGKSKEGGDLEPFIPILVELLLHGSVYGKQRKIEYDVCLEIQGLSRKHSSENPAFEETKIRSKATAALLGVLRSAPNDACRCRMADTIVSVLLEKYKPHFNKRYFADSQIHLLKLRVIQGLLLVHTYVSSGQVAVLIEFVMNSFCSESHQPSIKHLLQWLLIRLTTHSSHEASDFIDEIANKISYTDHTRPSTITAFIPILLHTCMGKPEETIEKLFSVLLPWTMGPQFKLRLYSQIAIKKLGDFCCAKPYESALHKYKATIDAIRLTLRESNEKEIRNILQCDEYFLDLFDPEGHYTLETIYIEIPRLDGVTPTEWELLRLQDLPESDNLKAHNRDEKLRKCVSIKKQQVDDVKESALHCTTNLQKKIIPWMHETRKELQSDLVLVCSLIESPANLGGLSRTCEVYGVKQMIINDGKTVHGKDFKSLSMSSENWVEFIEVKVEELRDYLMRAKQQGYAVIGAEQTSESVRLDGFRFPLKSVLVLGNEREGVSPSIIPLLDVCLEIPQFGFVRSLNVHVAGAIFIWEYVKQHLIT